MNKNELAHAIKQVRGCTQCEATELLDMFMEVLTEQLSQGQSINLQGFGVFKPWHQTLRQGRNPWTGESVSIHPRISIKFHPGKLLLEALNKKK
ncbi:HU family DNA-binding protein [uncultured Parabacteroides sp.]|jgi:DNA-binding protein HU-beta|uniref:HU family DNA-binding protein n=1 Tax=uncultured Parabacteroides sp. TaxID=512312 RepID=UPI0025F2BE37|nr:HU family DNA-binding protein [uncultured Parabacteroides sp.]